jgi:NifU-like protein involved in Fe-S cluster formation
MHSSQLLDHFENPRHVGELGPPALVAERMNPVCGDILRLSARFEDGRVVEAAYKARGCTACLAMGSAVTELMLGRTSAELRAIQASEVEAALGGLISESKHVAVLAVETLRALAAAGPVVR